MLRILGKSSSINARKVLWLCEEAAISYEQQDYGVGLTSTQTAHFKALNPNGLVPVIVDDDFVLWESNTICRYLAGREQRDDLLPLAPRQRALVEKWMDWQATELNNAWRYAFMGLVRESPAYSEQPAIAASIAGWNAHMGILEAQLAATGAYATGEYRIRAVGQPLENVADRAPRVSGNRSILCAVKSAACLSTIWQ